MFTAPASFQILLCDGACQPHASAPLLPVDPCWSHREVRSLPSLNNQAIIAQCNSTFLLALESKLQTNILIQFYIHFSFISRLHFVMVLFLTCLSFFSELISLWQPQQPLPLLDFALGRPSSCWSLQCQMSSTPPPCQRYHGEREITLSEKKENW